MTIKEFQIFEKSHSNKGWDKIEKWVEDKDVCAIDLMAIICAKFSGLPQVRANRTLMKSTQLMVCGDIYEVTIRKVK